MIRRILGGALLLAVKEWRAGFAVAGRTMTVDRVFSGYRARELANGTDPKLTVHRAFIARFG